MSKMLIQRLAGRLMPITRYYTPTSAIVKGSKGHFTIETGMTIAEIEFITTNVTNAEAEKVRYSIELNNDAIIELNGAEIHKFLRDFNGRKVQAGRFTIPLADMQYRTKDGILSSELVTLPTDRLMIHVTFDESISHASPGVKLRIRQTPSQRRRYFIPRMYSSSFDLLQAGRTKWKFPRFGVDKFVRRMHLIKDDITAVNVFQSGKAQNEMIATDNNYDLQNIGKKTPQSNVFTIDPTMYGFGLDGLQTTINNLEYELDVDSSGKCDFVVEMLEQVQDLPVISAG
jgi:hypothetical protein